MSVTEADLEQLESYLDDELSPGQAEDLHRRLASEPELGARLSELHQQRELRASMFRSLEPTDLEVERLISRVDVKLHRDAAWTRRLSRLRYVSSAAACLIVGFMMSHVIWPSAPHDEIYRTMPSNVGSPAAPATPTHGPIYQVVLQDESGNVIGVQDFNSLNEAREFQSDVGQLQNKRRQIQNNIRLITDQF
jgi:hypothetical protein